MYAYTQKERERDKHRDLIAFAFKFQPCFRYNNTKFKGKAVSEMCFWQMY